MTRLASRTKIAAIAVLALLLQATMHAPARSQEKSRFFQPIAPPRDVQVMAHCGLMQAAPENTRSAIELAIEDGLEWVEIDVRLTADQRHVVFHDTELDGKTDGQGAVADKTLAELQALDAGAWFAPRFAGTRLLSLAEALALAKGRINLYLDAKQFDAALLVEEVKAAGMENQVVVYADRKSLRHVREKSAGRIPVMCKWRTGDDIDSLVEEIAPAIVEIDAPEVTADVCRRFHERGIGVQAKVLGEWDRAAIWRRMLDAEVDYVQTDRPGEALAVYLARLYGERPRPVLMTCHRGASRYAPENTLAAFDAAARLRADLFEIDVRTTLDGGFVLMHDGTLDRTTNGRGAVHETDLAAIARLDAGSWFGRPYADTRVPTLDEFLAAFGEQTQIYFDAKDIEPTELVTALKRHKLIDRTIVYQSPGYLARIKELAPELRTLAPLFSPSSIEPLATKLKPTAFDVRWSEVSEELIAKCHERGVLVYADAPDEATVDDLLRAIGWGIDQIQTDRPLRLMRAMELWATRE